jgi:general secretion pathway protein G
MLVLALAAILGTFSVHSYRGYVERLRETQAINDIHLLSAQLQRWLTATSSLPDSLAEAGLDGLMDPWERPYVYLNVATATIGEVRKDKNLNPVNTDFDLYSLGRDGDSRKPFTVPVSRDDIVRANNGGYVGRAEDY